MAADVDVVSQALDIARELGIRFDDVPDDARVGIAKGLANAGFDYVAGKAKGHLPQAEQHKLERMAEQGSWAVFARHLAREVPDIEPLVLFRAGIRRMLLIGIKTKSATIDLPEGFGRGVLHDLDGHDKAVLHCVWSPSGEFVVTASLDGTMRIWDPAGGTCRKTLDAGAPVMACAVSGKGRVLAATGDGKLSLWDPRSGEASEVGGHDQPVLDCEITRDGRTGFAACHDGGIRVWDVGTASLRATLKGHTAEVLAVSASADGDRLVSAGADGAVRVWDVGAGVARLTLTGHRGAVRACALAPDGRRIFSGGEDALVCVWDAADGRKLSDLRGHQGTVNSVAASPDGSAVVSASDDMSVRVWDVDRAKPVVELLNHTQSVGSCAISPAGDRIVSGGVDCTVVVWGVGPSMSAGQTDGAAASAERAQGAAVAPAEPAHATAPITAAPVAAPQEGEELFAMILAVGPHVGFDFGASPETGREIIAHVTPYILSHVAWMAKDHMGRGKLTKLQAIAAQGDWDEFRQKLGKWARGFDYIPSLRAGAVEALLLTLNDVKKYGRKLQTFGLVHRLEGHAGVVLGCGFSPDGKTIATASVDRTVKVWNVADGSLLRTLEGHADTVNSCAFLPDGQLVSGSLDKTVKVWEAGTGLSRTLVGHEAGVMDVATGPHGMLASVGLDATVRVWSPDDATQRFAIALPEPESITCAFSPDGKVLAASSGGVVSLWDVATQSELRRLEGNEGEVSGIAFDPNGTWVVTGGIDMVVRFWNPQTGEVLRTFADHTNAITECAVSPDGRFVVTASADCRIGIYSIEQWRKIRLFGGHVARVWTVAFAPDSVHFASGSEDVTCRIWDVTNAIFQND